MSKPMSDERLQKIRTAYENADLGYWHEWFKELLDEIDRLRAQAKADEEALKAVVACKPGYEVG